MKKIIILVFTLTLSARAEDSTKTLLQKVGDQTVASYYGLLTGPSISKINGKQVDKMGEPSGPIELYNSFNIGWKAMDKVKVVFNPRINLPLGAGSKPEWLNPRIAASHSSLVPGVTGFNLWANLSAELAGTARAKSDGLIVGPGTSQAFTYDFTDSNFSTGLYTSFRTYFYKKPQTQKLWAVYFGPFANYKISDTLTATLLYEIDTSSRIGDVRLAKPVIDLKPGVAWDITKKINFNPYLVLLPADGITFKNTSIGFDFSATIL